MILELKDGDKIGIRFKGIEYYLRPIYNVTGNDSLILERV